MSRLGRLARAARPGDHAYDLQLDAQQSRDGLEPRQEENHERTEVTDLGRARVLLERRLLGEEVDLGNCNEAVLQCLLQLVSGTSSAEAKTRSRKRLTKRPFNDRGICQNKTGNFQVYVQYKKLRTAIRPKPDMCS